jgi:hypothetical protein
MGKKPEPVPEGPAKIAIDDFLKVDLRVGLVLTAAAREERAPPS